MHSKKYFGKKMTFGTKLSCIFTSQIL